MGRRSIRRIERSLLDGKLSQGDVVELTGVYYRTMDLLKQEGHLIPVSGGRGHGNHALFTPLQCLGIAVANQLMLSERGCSRAYAGKVIQAFSRTSIQSLKEQFSSGNISFLNVQHGIVYLAPLLGNEDFVDVQTLCREVLEGIDRLIDRAQKRSQRLRGRSRGSACMGGPS